MNDPPVYGFGWIQKARGFEENKICAGVPDK
jgi:hypothetical protein